VLSDSYAKHFSIVGMVALSLSMQTTELHNQLKTKFYSVLPVEIEPNFPTTNFVILYEAFPPLMNRKNLMF